MKRFVGVLNRDGRVWLVFWGQDESQHRQSWCDAWTGPDW